MEKNDENRVYGVTSKVTASQKAKFIQEAKKLNLSLSEWICGTLDMSINAYQEVDKSEMLIQLQKDNDEKTNIINGLKLQLNKVNALLYQKSQQIEQLTEVNSESDREVYYYRIIQK
jgi:hypothetical protein